MTMIYVHSHTGTIQWHTTVVGVARMTTLYHTYSTVNSVGNVVEYLHSCFVGDAGQIGTPPIVVLH